MGKTYWPSAIIQNEHDKRAWCCAINECELSLDDAKQKLEKLRTEHTVLCVWVDEVINVETDIAALATGEKTPDDFDVTTVFFENYVDAFGRIHN